MGRCIHLLALWLRKHKQWLLRPLLVLQLNPALNNYTQRLLDQHRRIY